MTRTAGDFDLVVAPVLSRSVLLRDEPLRTDVEYQRAGWAAARVVLVDERGRTPVTWDTPPGATFRDGDAAGWDAAAGSGGRLRTRAATEVADAPPGEAVLLGEYEGVAYWAMRGRPDLLAGEDPTAWADLRAVGAALDALGAGLLTTAVSVLNWHDAARFCARDGSPTEPYNAGWVRRCAEGHEEYPRTDPAVICLVHDGADRMLLARQPVWPPGRYSVLAGFVEAGESLEACVEREIREEVGLEVRDVRYLGSQAWPFPRSLMVGFHALADPDEPLHPDDGEIAEAFWITRDEVRAALARGDWDQRPEPGQRVVLLPGRVSIARSMLESWAASG
ncbi:NAD(+) diphosphatase [Pseudonocardia asaccharolytica]|uniref:NAD(+) diphosphatase n=1 Tax=Pseudonocardia asaccharolytica DSM 44247 = NBRC 16224 TaxID=1123024 RepID=A0A511D1K7_9PSEU|nr:NAD(+) diphosphatase [Pseudonocardia asaccharolytica]GEL18670.1 NADH pyrophosphatase [Pseudonocardia asaccharolytica DSM 44247 = NBRC 16224]